MKETKEIVITNNVSIKFPTKEDKKYGNMLILGNFNGVCGKVYYGSEKWRFSSDEHDGDRFSETLINNIGIVIDTVKNNSTIVIAASYDTISYFKHLIYACVDTRFFGENTKKNRDNVFKHFRTIDTTKISEDAAIYYNSGISNYRCGLAKDRIDSFIVNKIFNQIEKMKFDTIIQNPPYSGSLHLDFLNKGLDLLTDTGKMVIVEPATWLINVRKNGKAKKYDTIKERLGKHVQSVTIENLNNEFKTRLLVPFTTTTIDLSKEFNTIDFNCCGESKKVESIYDCNLIGNYTLIWNILNKVQSFGDMMYEHITKEDKSSDYWYTKYAEIMGSGLCGDITRAYSDVMYRNSYNGEYNINYFTCGYHTENGNGIENTPICRNDFHGNKKEGNIGDNIYGSKKELENWKHFIFNNKLSLFINIVMTIDQNNNSKEFLPWLVDRQYSDDDINKIFNFTDEEINLIDNTIKKYERNSPWFKRYIFGPSSVSDEEVNNFIQTLN